MPADAVAVHEHFARAIDRAEMQAGNALLQVFAQAYFTGIRKLFARLQHEPVRNPASERFRRKRYENFTFKRAISVPFYFIKIPFAVQA